MADRTGPKVDPTAAINHIQALYQKGMLIRAMVEQSTLSDRMLRCFVDGYAVRKGQRRPLTMCRESTVASALGIVFVDPWTAEGFRPDLLRFYREGQGFSRYALGHAADVAPESIQYWETGRSLPLRKEKIDAVLKVLGIEWENVSGGDSAINEPPTLRSENDEYIMTFSGHPDSDYASDYPCCVCGIKFRSRNLLATHEHRRKVKS